MGDDGGMQWYAEVGCREEQERRIEEAKRMSKALEDHRKWVAEFNEKEKEHGTVRAG